MGADLLTIIVTGPTKLKRSKALEARLLKRANATIEAAKRARKDPKFLWLNNEFLQDFDESEINDIADTDANQTLADLYNVWDGAARDAACRVIKQEGKPLRIVVAGDMSWGDEPDGYGYTTLRDAARLGFFAPLGID
jgi:hypothetical protein